MTESQRVSALADRHRALGSGLEDWNGMGTAWSYDTDPNDEHDAVREAAGLFDMTPLKKIRLSGPDAGRVVDHVMTRDMTKIYPGKSAYAAVLTERGTVCDDAIAANQGEAGWLLCHGSGESMERVRESAEGLNVDVERDEDLHILSLQGPAALDILQPAASQDLSGLRYFHHQSATLFGKPCHISRTGYSGERGYEIFVDRSDAVDLWDAILDVGAGLGVKPCSFTALDKVRVEAALLFFGYDMTDDHSPWEVGLGFTVSRNKGPFRGKEAVFARESQRRFVLAGIVADHDDALMGGETLFANGIKAGTVNSPAWSHRLGKSLALVHLGLDASTPGTKLDVRGEDLTCSATVEAIPFFDPQKTRTHV